jgi:hypothetical protein
MGWATFWAIFFFTNSSNWSPWMYLALRRTDGNIYILVGVQFDISLSAENFRPFANPISKWIFNSGWSRRRYFQLIRIFWLIRLSARCLKTERPDELVKKWYYAGSPNDVSLITVPKIRKMTFTRTTLILVRTLRLGLKCRSGKSRSGKRRSGKHCSRHCRSTKKVAQNVAKHIFCQK